LSICAHAVRLRGPHLATMTSVTQFNPSAVLQRMLGGATATSVLYIAAELWPVRPARRRSVVPCRACRTHSALMPMRSRASCAAGHHRRPGHQRRAHLCALAPLGTALRSDAGSPLVTARLMAHPIASRAWGGPAAQPLRPGEPAFDHAHGCGLRHLYAADPDFGQVFNASRAASRLTSCAVISA
jgi:hypothetical protein